MRTPMHLRLPRVAGSSYSMAPPTCTSLLVRAARTLTYRPAVIGLPSGWSRTGHPPRRDRRPVAGDGKVSHPDSPGGRMGAGPPLNASSEMGSKPRWPKTTPPTANQPRRDLPTRLGPAGSPRRARTERLERAEPLNVIGVSHRVKHYAGGRTAPVHHGQPGGLPGGRGEGSRPGLPWARDLAGEPALGGRVRQPWRGRASTVQGARTDVTAAWLDGSGGVGWDDFLGIDHHRHRLGGATVGFEAFPANPGLLGWRRPVSPGHSCRSRASPREW